MRSDNQNTLRARGNSDMAASTSNSSRGQVEMIKQPIIAKKWEIRDKVHPAIKKDVKFRIRPPATE